MSLKNTLCLLVVEGLSTEAVGRSQEGVVMHQHGGHACLCDTINPCLLIKIVVEKVRGCLWLPAWKLLWPKMAICHAHQVHPCAAGSVTLCAQQTCSPQHRSAAAQAPHPPAPPTLWGAACHAEETVSVLRSLLLVLQLPIHALVWHWLCSWRQAACTPCMLGDAARCLADLARGPARC